MAEMRKIQHHGQLSFPSTFLSLLAVALLLPGGVSAEPTRKIQPKVLYPKPLLMSPLPVLAIICGRKTDFVDSRGNVWEGDANPKNPVYFTSSTSTDTLATSATIAGANPSSQAIYQSERSGLDFTYKLPVSQTGAYYLVLYFAEIFFLQKGIRRFNVKVNNRLLIANLDIVEQIGPYAALSYKVPLYSTSKFIYVRFAARQDHAKISAIAIFRGTFPKNPPTTPAPVLPPGVPYFAVAAGRLTDFKDPSGIVWRGDASKATTVSYSGGGPASTDQIIANTKRGLAPIYQTERSGDIISYVIRTPAIGKYVLEIFFCEFYFTNASQRIFNVFIQGKLVLSKFDIIKAAGGPLRGISYKFPVSIAGRGDTILLRFIGVVSSAKLSGFSVAPWGNPPSPKPTPTTRQPSPTPWVIKPKLATAKRPPPRVLRRPPPPKKLVPQNPPPKVVIRRSPPPPFKAPSMNSPRPKPPPPQIKPAPKLPPPAKSPPPPIPKPNRYVPTAVTRWRYDEFNTGYWANEFKLNTVNVKSNFGFLFNILVDGAVYGQPLYVPDVKTKNGTQNALYVATENNSVYAINADTGAIIWSVNFNKPPGVIPVSVADVGYCGDIAQYGITSTPVIDLTSGTIYVVANTKENENIVYRLHGLDLTTGAARPGSPTAPITATLFGHTFDGKAQLNRPGLVIDNGILYMAFGSHCDNFPFTYHGWLFGYNIKTFQQVKGFITTPGGPDVIKGALLTGAIWMSGAAPAVKDGMMYVATGNGYFDGKANFGETILKLNLRAPGYLIPVVDYFTPSQYQAYNGGDIEVGSSGVTIISNTANTDTIVQVGKPAIAWVMKANKMGKFVKCFPTNENCTNQDRHAYQAWPMPNYGDGKIIGLSPCQGNTAYYPSSNSLNGMLYIANGPNIYQYVVNNGRVRLPHRAEVPPNTANPFGASPILTGTPTGKPVLWVLGEKGAQVLRAFDAFTMEVLFDSSKVVGQPDLNFHIPFSVPLVVNGRLYTGAATTSLTRGFINVFGLKS